MPALAQARAGFLLRVDEEMNEIEQLEAQILAEIAAAGDEQALEAVRLAALGKKGSVSERLKTLGAMSADERKVMGPALNGLKDRVTEALAARREVLRKATIAARLEIGRAHV